MKKTYAIIIAILILTFTSCTGPGDVMYGDYDGVFTVGTNYPGTVGIRPAGQGQQEVNVTLTCPGLGINSDAIGAAAYYSSSTKDGSFIYQSATTVAGNIRYIQATFTDGSI